MSLIIIGSIAIDKVKTPVIEGENLPGGSAIYASLGASFFTTPKIRGVVGSDFKKEWLEILKKRKIDTSGIEVKAGKTFRWSGVYNNFNEAQTLKTELNVFSQFEPLLSGDYNKSDYVFLGNIKPKLQEAVLNQLKKRTVVGLDTMNYWIKSDRERLINILQKVDILFVNEKEAKMLSEEDNIFAAIDRISNYFKGAIVIKRGEYGAFIYKNGKYFFSPAYPKKEIVDTTGAGDTFAGAFMGYLTKSRKTDFQSFKTALLYGIVTASYTIEALSFYGLSEIGVIDLHTRFNELKGYIGL